jgi:hypothetical protein
MARDKIREMIRPEIPAMSFGDIVGLVIHDWEGSHGPQVKGPDGRPHGHGPLVDVAGQRVRLAGDDDVLPAVARMRSVNSDAELTAALKDRKRSDAERTFAAASLAVRASVNDIKRALDLAQTDTNRSRIIGKLTDKDGLFAAERLLPSVVPDSKQPEEDHMPKWDYETVDQLLSDPKIRAALPMSADRVGKPFKDTLDSLDASPAVKDHLRGVVVQPLTSGSVPRIVAWLKGVIDYSEATLFARLRAARARASRARNDLRPTVGAR